MNYLIGVDLGTSGTKTVLFDTEGTVISSATVEYPMYQRKRLGRAGTGGLVGRHHADHKKGN